MAKRGSVSIDTVPLPERTIRVTVPAKVAFDLDAIQKVQGSILDRLGCPACCSGYDIRFDIARSFLVDKNLKIRELAEGGVVIDG
jgi:hypothetical protein